MERGGSVQRAFASLMDFVGQPAFVDNAHDLNAGSASKDGNPAGIRFRVVQERLPAVPPARAGLIFYASAGVAAGSAASACMSSTDRPVIWEIWSRGSPSASAFRAASCLPRSNPMISPSSLPSR